MNDMSNINILSSIICRMISCVSILDIVCDGRDSLMADLVSRLDSCDSNSMMMWMLQILHSFADEMNNMILERRNILLVDECLKKHVPAVCRFWVKILKHQQAPTDAVEMIITSVGCWSARKIGLLTQPELVQALLEYYPKPDYFEQVNGILVIMLEAHSTGWLFNSYTIQEIVHLHNINIMKIEKANSEGVEALKVLESDTLVQGSAQIILNYLLTVVAPMVEQSISKKDDQVTKGFADIFVQLIKSFPSYLVTIDQEMSKQIYRYSIVLLMHKDNSVSNYSLDLWMILHRIVAKNSKNLDEKHLEFFFECYNEVFLID